MAYSEDMDMHRKGTRMSISNLMSYLIGRGNLTLKWEMKKQNNKKVGFPETGYKWNELGELAQKFYEKYHNSNFTTQIQMPEKIVADILKLLEAKSNAQLYQLLYYEQFTHGRMIQLNTSSPYKNAYKRIRKW